MWNLSRIIVSAFAPMGKVPATKAIGVSSPRFKVAAVAMLLSVFIRVLLRLSHKSFLLAAVIIGVCIPVVVLLAEPLVTFYRDRQLLGLFARVMALLDHEICYSQGPSRPRFGIAGTLCGMRLRGSTDNHDQFSDGNACDYRVWVVAFAIAVALGVLVYCTLLWFVLFNVRWWANVLANFRNSLLSDDVNAKNNNAASPMSTGWTMRGSEGEEYRMNK
ncbi:hypothetical protein GQ600_13304 [Phytophthora cactorum]|nr:hypothetical protein GQ600_13304 [Phytophthora cactorum]